MDEETVAFAVMKTENGWQPTLITIDEKGEVKGYKALHEPTIYKALAYEYLQGDVRVYYGEQWKRDMEKSRSVPAETPKQKAKKGKKY